MRISNAPKGLEQSKDLKHPFLASVAPLAASVALTLVEVMSPVAWVTALPAREFVWAA
jgi:hypothetical protein